MTKTLGISAATEAPALFLAHGSPIIAIHDNDYTGFLEELGRSIPQAEAIVVFTAHWESEATRITYTDGVHETVHDFGPWWLQELFDVEYPAKGAPALAARVDQLLQQQGFTTIPDTQRGLDHGTWTLLRRLYPDADVPVVQLSVNPNLAPKDQYRIGRAVRELRKEGVLILGSGVTVHNLGLDYIQETQPWALEFDDWLIKKIKDKDYEALFNYEELAPHAKLAVPTAEHFVPMFIALGSGNPEDEAQVIYRSYDRVLSYLSLQF